MRMYSEKLKRDVNVCGFVCSQNDYGDFVLGVAYEKDDAGNWKMLLVNADEIHPVE